MERARNTLSKERTTCAVLAPVIDPEVKQGGPSARLQASPWLPPRGLRPELAHQRLKRARSHDIDCWINYWKPHTNTAGTLQNDHTRADLEKIEL